jgi:predicted nucleotidyltransferase
MTGPLEIDRVAVTELCRRHGVRRLLVFGSAVRADFDEATSDVDFLAEFHDSLPNRFDAYFGLKEDLESLLGRLVDLRNARRRNLGSGSCSYRRVTS